MERGEMEEEEATAANQRVLILIMSLVSCKLFVV